MVKVIDSGVQKILLEANNHWENNEYFQSVEKYKEALFFLEDEDKIEVLFQIADIFSDIENYKGANKTYSEILDINPNISGAWYGLAFTNEIIGGDIKNSLSYYEKAIELDKEYKEAYYYAATIYGDLNENHKAIEYLNKVIDLDPDDFVSYNDLGSIYESLKDYDKAVEYLNKSISINSNYYLSYFNLGVVYKAMGDYKKALKYYMKSTEFSNSRFNYLNMSAIYIELKEYKKAIDILTEGIKRNPHHILYYNRACSYSKMGDIKKALEDFKKAYEIDTVVMDWAKKDPDLKDIIQEEK